MSFDFNHYWQKLQSGDEKALELLIKEVNGSLCYYAFQITGDTIVAEEIVQDVFFRLWQNRTEVAIKGSIEAYLYQSTHNLAINNLIKNNCSFNKLISADLGNNIEATYSINHFLLEKLEAEETAEIIDKTVRELPKQCGEIFSLSRFENKTNKEIASLFDISENTVRVDICNALEKILEALEKRRKNNPVFF